MNDGLVILCISTALLSLFGMQARWHDPVLKNEPLCLRLLDRIAMCGYICSLLWLSNYVYKNHLAALNPITALVLCLMILSAVRAFILIARSRVYRFKGIHPWSLVDAWKGQREL